MRVRDGATGRRAAANVGQSPKTHSEQIASAAPQCPNEMSRAAFATSECPGDVRLELGPTSLAFTHRREIARQYAATRSCDSPNSIGGRQRALLSHEAEDLVHETRANASDRSLASTRKPRANTPEPAWGKFGGVEAFLLRSGEPNRVRSTPMTGRNVAAWSAFSPLDQKGDTRPQRERRVARKEHPKPRRQFLISW